MIELIDFKKEYYNISQKTPVFSVNDINIKINKGQIIGLLGPNGSGKSTIIKAICGFHFPTEGKVLVSNENNVITDIELFPEKAMELIGYVPEQSILPGEMKVYDFLEYSGKMHGLSGEKLLQAIKEAVKVCSLEKILSKKIKTISKGYAQRVSFAQAIIHNPPNLILDEPVSGLDPSQIIQMRELIKKLSETKAVLMSTHLLQEVNSLCDEVYIISEGKVVINGSESYITTKTESKNLEEAFFKLIKTE